jgi:NMD protein affecting ribosome stability and mRNA decay
MFRMCDKCKELDKQIEEYQVQIRSADDMREVERLQALVRELISQKIGFHSSRI